MTHKNTVKTQRAKENSAILEETQSQCTVGRRSLLLWCKANVFRLRELGFTTFPVFSLRFPFSANLITVFSASQMVHSPKIFSKNLFEMLMNLTSPKFPEVYVVNNPCSCAVHRHVQ